MNLILILGNHLFDLAWIAKKGLSPDNTLVFMREDHELASYYKFHKHKIIFFFAAMRLYRDELRKAGYQVHYEELAPGNQSLAKSGKNKPYEEFLTDFIQQKKIETVFHFEVEDRFFELRLKKALAKNEAAVKVWQSPMFLTSRSQFENYLKGTKKPFMKNFYEQQRKRLKILVEEGQPVGGAWSFDTENRKSLPRGVTTPALPDFKITPLVQEVQKLVDQEFSDHPGASEDFWLPCDRAGAQAWLRAFLTERLEDFGPYEDAISPESDFVFHSVLTPFLNTGLLTPNEVIKAALRHHQEKSVPLQSLEGFVRQVIGWREFVRGIYQNFDSKQRHSNFWNHDKKLSALWYEGNTGVPPLDETLRRVLKRGYAHHIERLMILGSLMLLLEVDPNEGHRWFMEMFVDSSDWVMGPNVYGMALFSDGGIFATKPYICGSNYLRKMGGYKTGPWCDGVDGLYWEFIKKHKEFFLKNPRLSMMARSCEKISSERWEILHNAASELRNKLAVS